MHEKLQHLVTWVNQLIHPTILLFTDNKALIAMRKNGLKPTSIINNSKEKTTIIVTK